MTATTQINAIELQAFSDLIDSNINRFIEIERNMNDCLRYGFTWEDGVGRRFKENYEQGMKSLTEKLLPALRQYRRYLADQAQKAESIEKEFTERKVSQRPNQSSSSSSTTTATTTTRPVAPQRPSYAPRMK